MCIQKFKTILEFSTKKRVYTGLVYCYWFEGAKIRRKVFHEDELVQYKIPG